MFKVYIIYSAVLDKYYVGHTSDIEGRMRQHITGLSSYTSKAKDWELKYDHVEKLGDWWGQA